MHLNRSLGRGLKMLAILNTGGEHRVASLARAVKLPRSTAFRILCTLVEEGYVWRDAVTSWFLRASGIPDRTGRAGHYPGRVEAESMQLTGYAIHDVTPWEAASGGKAVECLSATCSAAFLYKGAPGWYTLRVRYFDQNNGVSRFRLFIDAQPVDEWEAADQLPGNKVDGTTATRRTVAGLNLRPGDTIRIEATPNSGELAALDFIEIVPAR